MKIHATNGTWTVSLLASVRALDPSLMFMTSECAGCHQDLPLGLEVKDSVVTFTCPHCGSTQQDHASVVAVDKEGLAALGWVTTDV